MNTNISTLVNIHQLIGIQDTNIKKVVKMDQLNCIQNAYIIIQDEAIVDYGKMEELDLATNSTNIIDLKGHCVLPCWNDSHTHLVFGGTREQEFVDRINGLSYQEIAARGGGILNSAKKMEHTSLDELYESAAQRLEDVMKMGTGAIEIKSGYGLNIKNELKMLRVIQQLKEKYTIPIKSTFLGAHALPVEYKNNKQGYLDLIINEMMPNIAEENLADYVIQINGKKRAILNESRDIEQDSLMDKIKLNKLSNKYLKGKSIYKIIFVKNRLINLLINE